MDDSSKRMISFVRGALIFLGLIPFADEICSFEDKDNRCVIFLEQIFFHQLINIILVDQHTLDYSKLIRIQFTKYKRFCTFLTSVLLTIWIILM